LAIGYWLASMSIVGLGCGKQTFGHPSLWQIHCANAASKPVGMVRDVEQQLNATVQ
jgi:hypothetical protein